MKARVRTTLQEGTGLDKAVLLGFFETELAVDVSDIDGETLLFSRGVIDSFSLVLLISFIESRCGFRMSPIDVNLDNLDSIDRILAYVQKKCAAGLGPTGS